MLFHRQSSIFTIGFPLFERMENHYSYFPYRCYFNNNIITKLESRLQNGNETGVSSCYFFRWTICQDTAHRQLTISSTSSDQKQFKFRVKQNPRSHWAGTRAFFCQACQVTWRPKARCHHRARAKMVSHWFASKDDCHGTVGFS